MIVRSAWTLLLLVVAGCGYVPMSSIGSLPADVSALYVDADEGLRGDPELAEAIERELRRVVRSDARFRLTSAPEQADAVLRVQLDTSITRPVAFDQYDDPLDYETTVTIDASLTRTGGQALWTARDLGATRAHAAVAGAVVTSSSAFVSSERLRPEDLASFDAVQLGEQRLMHARDALASDIAASVYSRMTEGR